MNLRWGAAAWIVLGVGCREPPPAQPPSASSVNVGGRLPLPEPARHTDPVSSSDAPSVSPTPSASSPPPKVEWPAPEAGAKAQVRACLPLRHRIAVATTAPMLEHFRNGRVVRRCGDFQVVEIHPEAWMTVRRYAGVEEVIKQQDRQAVSWPPQPADDPSQSGISFEALACLGMQLDKSCGEVARFRQPRSGCSPVLDVDWLRPGYVALLKLHLVPNPPDLEGCSE